MKRNQNKVNEELETNTLYKLLNVERVATEHEIVYNKQMLIQKQKKSYRILALRFHPDKNPDDEKAKEMFQQVASAYEVLSNPKRREQYDLTGDCGDGNQEQFQQAYEYFRCLYPKITLSDIEQFEVKYRHGDMESEDLVNFYNSFINKLKLCRSKGDMRALLESIPLSLNTDIQRFIQFYDDAISQNKIKKLKRFDQTRNCVRIIKVEQQQASESLQTLTTAIQLRKVQNFDRLFDNLEKKYANIPDGNSKIKKKIKKSQS